MEIDRLVFFAGIFRPDERHEPLPLDMKKGTAFISYVIML